MPEYMKMKKRLRDAPILGTEEVKIVHEAQRSRAESSNSNYKWHVYHVYNDNNFVEVIQLLREKLENKYYPNISMDIDDTHLVEEDKALIVNIANLFSITTSDLTTFADGWYDVGLNYGHDNVLEMGGFRQSGQHGLCYVVGPKTTLKDIQNEWPLIEKWKEEYYGKGLTRRKATDDPELIYAIYKARLKPLKFSEIFRNYQEGTLENYHDKPRNQFNSSDSLERYYNRSKPQNRTP